MDHRFLILLTDLAHIFHSTSFKIVVTTEGSILGPEMRSEDRPYKYKLQQQYTTCYL